MADWVLAAMKDDNLVVEILLQLRHSDSRRTKSSLPLPPLDWGCRKPRSNGSAAVFASLKKKRDSYRRVSPTTPLSWTAGEQSIRPIFLAVRNQGSAATDTTNSGSANKKSRKKRTFEELKEAESSLLKQRKKLNKQIESVNMKLKEKRLCNESLKRIKSGLHAESATVNKQTGSSSNNGATETSIDEQQPQVFVLPDLNMTPESIYEMI